jgi:hypothetical protein
MRIELNMIMGNLLSIRPFSVRQRLQSFILILALCSANAFAQSIAIGLFGDTAYTARERELLPILMAEMDREDLAFVIHDGDIKSGGSLCSDAVFLDILGVFQSSRHPLIYVPGDNEWTDCHRQSNGPFDPLERLSKLRELFFSDEKTLGQRQFELTRQSRDPAYAAYRENVRWEAAGVLFVGLNVPGSENNYHGSTRNSGPVPEFLERSGANRIWLAQAFERARSARLAGVVVVIQANPDIEAANAGRPVPGFRDFLQQLRDETLAFAGQVLLVHGDSHQHQLNQPLRMPGSGALVANFTRLETYGSPAMGWVKVTVDTQDPKVFRFEPRPFSAR